MLEHYLLVLVVKWQADLSETIIPDTRRDLRVIDEYTRSRRN